MKEIKKAFWTNLFLRKVLKEKQNSGDGLYEGRGDQKGGNEMQGYKIDSLKKEEKQGRVTGCFALSTKTHNVTKFMEIHHGFIC